MSRYAIREIPNGQLGGGGAIVGYGPVRVPGPKCRFGSAKKGKAHPQDMKARRRSVAQDERHHRLGTSSSPTPQNDLTHAAEQQEGISRDIYYGAEPTR